jgi:hypothetical protein
MRTNPTPSFGTWVVMEVPKRSVNPLESIPSLSAPSTTNPGLKRSPFFQQILKLGFILTSCTIDSGPKISGGRIQVSKSIQRKKGLLLRPGCFRHFLHHRSRSQNSGGQMQVSKSVKRKKGLFLRLEFVLSS